MHQAASQALRSPIMPLTYCFVCFCVLFDCVLTQQTLNILIQQIYWIFNELLTLNLEMEEQKSLIKSQACNQQQLSNWKCICYFKFRLDVPFTNKYVNYVPSVYINGWVAFYYCKWIPLLFWYVLIPLQSYLIQWATLSYFTCGYTGKGGNPLGFIGCLYQFPIKCDLIFSKVTTITDKKTNIMFPETAKQTRTMMLHPLSQNWAYWGRVRLVVTSKLQVTM